ncbi:MAG: ABC transporter substrate-binding protein, partial [Gammaproteobacteria bacterium]|nr:ABC transporter substrate-binding protein [Gammaproteobacteria bacterium]
MNATKLIISVVACLTWMSAHADISVQDDLGQTVTLAQPARRIVSLAPHVTEMLFAAGADNYLVGTVSYSDYPEAAKRIPRVGGYTSLDLEAVVALRPDLIVAWKSGNAAHQLEKLRALGFAVYV